MSAVIPYIDFPFLFCSRIVNMVNFDFFGRLLQRKQVISPSQLEGIPKKEDPERLRIRESNFEKALSAFLRRPPSEEERALARRTMTNAETGNLLPMTVEDMREQFTKLDLHPSPEPDGVIGDKTYEPRGDRQRNFEHGLRRVLGGDLTDSDVAEAREYIKHDTVRRRDWPTMTGEEATHYGEKVAHRLLVRRLRHLVGTDRGDVLKQDEEAK